MCSLTASLLFHTNCPSNNRSWTSSKYSFYAASSWWYILPPYIHDPKCKSIMQTSGDNIDWTLVARQRQKFIIACCLPLALIEVLPLLYLFSEAAIELVQVVFHPRGDSSPNYCISGKIWSWPTLSIGPNFVLLWLIKLFSYSAASLLQSYKLASCKLGLMWHAGNQSRAGKWKNNALSFGLQKENCDHSGYCLHLHHCTCLCKIAMDFLFFRDSFFALLQIINKMWWHVRLDEATFTKPSLCDRDTIRCGCHVRTKCQ